MSITLGTTINLIDQSGNNGSEKESKKKPVVTSYDNIKKEKEREGKETNDDTI